MYMKPSNFNILYPLYTSFNKQMRRQIGFLCLSISSYILDCERKLCGEPKLLHPSQHVSNCDSEHITLRKKKMQR